MAESKKDAKGSQPGKKENSAVTPKKESVMRRVVSFLRRKRRTPVLAIPHSKPVGNVFYTVTSTIEPVTFYRKRDAKQFSELLERTTNYYSPVIIRREVTKEGYIPTYGEEND